MEETHQILYICLRVDFSVLYCLLSGLRVIKLLLFVASISLNPRASRINQATTVNKSKENKVIIFKCSRTQGGSEEEEQLTTTNTLSKPFTILKIVKDTVSCWVFLVVPSNGSHCPNSPTLSSASKAQSVGVEASSHFGPHNHLPHLSCGGGPPASLYASSIEDDS